MNFLVDLACQITNNTAVILGGLVAIIISAFFYKKQTKIQDNLSEISSTYIIRTALINLKVIYSGGDERTPATNKRKKRYTDLLRHNKPKFIKQNPESEDLVNSIYDYTEKNDLEFSGDHTNFIDEVEELLSKYPNPFHISEEN